MTIANPQSFNRYAYVNNDPVNFVDPSGLLIWAPSIGNFTVDVPISFGGPINSFLWEHLFGSAGGPLIGGTTDTGGPGVEEPPQNPTPGRNEKEITNCQRFAAAVDVIANYSHSETNFLDELARTFLRNTDGNPREQ